MLERASHVGYRFVAMGASAAASLERRSFPAASRTATAAVRNPA